MTKPKLDQLVSKIIDKKDIKYDKEFNKISGIHKYWARKPWYIIKQFIDAYSSIGDTVLDPFCGSGVIGLESILKGRNFIGYDLNPSAIFISENLLADNFEDSSFKRDRSLLIQTLKPKIMDLYKFGDSYIRYLISGPKQEKPYNCVLMDYDFRKGSSIKVSKDILEEEFEIPHEITIPDMPFPDKFYKDRFSYKGVSHVSNMFSERNLLALGILYDYLKKSSLINLPLFEIAFTNTLLHVSKLKGENVRPLSVNNYWIPDDYIQENVIWRYLERLERVKNAKQVISTKRRSKKIIGKHTLYLKSSIELTEIPDKSIDYIFTDPPYGDSIQYSELSYIWNTWLGSQYEIDDEIIINPVQEKGEEYYQESLKSFIENSRRVLKEDGFFTLTFQNKDVGIWLNLVKDIKKAGFFLAEINTYDTFGNPYNKNWAKFSPKSDIYLTLSKKQSNFSYFDESNLSADQLVEKIFQISKTNGQNIFDLNKNYDIFVTAVICALFEDVIINGLERKSLKDIVKIFQNYYEKTKERNQ